MQTNDFDPHSGSTLPARPELEGRVRRGNLILISFLVLLVVAALVLGISPQLSHARSSATKLPLKIDSSPAPVNLAELKNGYSSVIDPALPGVVNISSTKVVKRENSFPGFFFDDPFFRQFFGDQFDRQRSTPETEREYSLGSGVIVNPDGYILTNNHVVSGASDIEVFTQDKKKFRAKLIGTDSRTDVAVLKIDATRLPSLTLGDSSRLKVGDVVFAVGDPFGIGETATMGIVSATGRGLGGAIERYEDFIQTDAAINPGNSGGALLDLHGDLIGINTAIITGNGGGGSQGVGFAIPINMARLVVEQIVDHGKVIRGHLGIAIQSVDADMAKAFGLTQGGGALVAQVTPGSPAAKAGVERGDVILELNGEPVKDPDELSVRIAEMTPGTTVHLKISRNGKMQNIGVTLDELSEEAKSTEGASHGAALHGVHVQNLTPEIARQLGVPTMTPGVVVTSMDSDSAAAAAGLQQGDVIQEVNRKPVHNVREYARTLEGLHGESILLLVTRGQDTRFIVVPPQ